MKACTSIFCAVPIRPLRFALCELTIVRKAVSLDVVSNQLVELHPNTLLTSET